KVIYDYRRSILEGEEEIYDLVRDLITAAVQDLIAYCCPKRTVSPEEYQRVIEAIHQVTAIALPEIKKEGFNETNSEELKQDVIDFMLMKYELYRNQKNAEQIKDAEKWLMLETIDQAWKQHMLNLDHLKEGIGLRSWGQKNPLI